jgi:SRSO17 transposase
MRRVMRGEGGLARAEGGMRVGAFSSGQRWRRTAASASTNVGSCFVYHAACRVGRWAGESWYDWARVRLARLQLTAQERRWDHLLLLSRSRTDQTDRAYYVVFAPAGTSLRALAHVAEQRWRIEQSIEQRFELAKGAAGLDPYEVRRWDGWYRHRTLAKFALAYLAVLRAHQ